MAKLKKIQTNRVSNKVFKSSNGKLCENVRIKAKRFFVMGICFHLVRRARLDGGRTMGMNPGARQFKLS